MQANRTLCPTSRARLPKARDLSIIGADERRNVQWVLGLVHHQCPCVDSAGAKLAVGRNPVS
jgi:hypothetical protein